MSGKFLRYLPRIVLILFFVGWSVFLYYSSPEALLEVVGVQNAYLLMFLLALFGGFSTFGVVPYHVILVTFAMGGLHPLLLGLSAAGGVMIGDATSYYIGYQGGTIVPRGIQRVLQQFCAFCSRYPRFMPLFFYFYGSCVPFSNDAIVISMGLARYPFWRVMVPLGLGNITFNISLAYGAPYIYDFVKSFTG